MTQEDQDIKLTIQQYLREHKIQIAFNTVAQCREVHEFMDHGTAMIPHGFVSFHRQQITKYSCTTYRCGMHEIPDYTVLSFIEFEMLTTNSYGLLMAICL